MKSNESINRPTDALQSIIQQQERDNLHDGGGGGGHDSDALPRLPSIPPAPLPLPLPLPTSQQQLQLQQHNPGAAVTAPRAPQLPPMLPALKEHQWGEQGAEFKSGKFSKSESALVVRTIQAYAEAHSIPVEVRDGMGGMGLSVVSLPPSRLYP